MSGLAVEVQRVAQPDGTVVVQVTVQSDRTLTVFSLSSEYAKAVSASLLEAATGLCIPRPEPVP